MIDVVQSLLTAQGPMEDVRSGYEDAMQACFDTVNPRRYDMTGASRKGAVRRTKQYDGVPADAFWTWVHGMQGWVVTEDDDWQRAVITDRRFRHNDAAERYCQEYTEQMEVEFREALYYDNVGEFLQDAASGGTAAMLVEESASLDRAVLRVPHPGRYWIDRNADGVYDVYHEKLTLKARQCLQKYSEPGDTLHPTILKWAKDPASANWEVTLLQCIRPADDGIFPRRLVWSKYVLVTLLLELHAGSGVTNPDSVLDQSSNRLIRIQPLDYFSPAIWPFRCNSDELYGYSPAMDVMVAIETAQSHAKNLLDMGNFAASPMMAVPDEGRTSFSRKPRANFYFGSEKRIPSVIEMAREYPVAVDREERIHALIRSRYGYNVWNALQSLQQKRERVQAREVIEARSDQARLIAPQHNSFWRKGVFPVFDSLARIADAGGRLPEPPAVLDELREKGGNIIRPKPIGPLAVIQMYARRLGSMREGFTFINEIAEITGRHLGADVARKIYARIKLEDLAEYVGDHTNFPQELMNSDEETAALIDADDRKAAAEAMAKNAQAMAAATAKMAPVAESGLLAAGVA